MKRRRLTVSSTCPESRARLPRPTLPPIPFLRLRGRWLDEAGFTIGKPVRVSVSRGRIALEVIDDENQQD
jgi:hypothetical protein